MGMPFFLSGFLRCGLIACAAGLGNFAAAAEPYTPRQRTMLDDIARMAQETRRETGRAAFSERVMAALGKIPRHRFVPPAEESSAYLNRPLAIGSGQTISQPYIVALMTDVLDLKPGDDVLEIGTGSGYQAAVLAEVGARVHTIEIVEPLARQAAKTLDELGYRDIQKRIGDGYRGWPEAAPFDAIIVTAAAPEVPPALIEQLKAGGRMVIPVGASVSGQTLYLIEKQANGSVTRRTILAVRFVPFTRAPER
jgi:protein-L-isoaspartate(D-aspartate) O-methyltransferase